MEAPTIAAAKRIDSGATASATVELPPIRKGRLATEVTATAVIRVKSRILPTVLSRRIPLRITASAAFPAAMAIPPRNNPAGNDRRRPIGIAVARPLEKPDVTTAPKSMAHNTGQMTA
ncbi:hypothetical protein [Rhodococcus sp. UNC363MFTsu5.1]|uniref:hypothetical protein n=1 Tax=Rhodococcus sp. UNC363MFTsu5.1 TaxID=1449069 RepID=UPI0012DE3CAE|nr:hypothetical protein [Rhodococcus sp. UNC363MFTsu5.1]